MKPQRKKKDFCVFLLSHPHSPSPIPIPSHYIQLPPDQQASRGRPRRKEQPRQNALAKSWAGCSSLVISLGVLTGRPEPAHWLRMRTKTQSEAKVRAGLRIRLQFDAADPGPLCSQCLARTLWDEERCRLNDRPVLLLHCDTLASDQI